MITNRTMPSSDNVLQAHAKTPPALSQLYSRGGAPLRPPLPGTGPSVSPRSLPINLTPRFLFGNRRSATCCGVISPENEPK